MFPKLVTEHPGHSLIVPLLYDTTITDILINSCHNIFVERGGIMSQSTITFPDETLVHAFGEAIAKAVGRELSTAKPYVDARLPDGSRVNVVGPPLAIDGTMISIRKFPEHRITLDEMVAIGTLSQPMAEFLKACGHARVNMVISGGTGSGKTTLLNAIADYADPRERIVTVEDAAELRIHKPHVVRLETRPRAPNVAEEDVIIPRDLVRNALRMRPDRIIVGEVRDAEAYDMLQAMNTGHEGSLTTIHSNHPRDALSRIENLLNYSMANVPIRAMRGQIVSAIHLIVQVSRMKDGVRRVSFISELTGMEGDIITMQDIFQYTASGETQDGKLQGDFRYTGIVPRIVRRFKYWNEEDRIQKALGIRL